MRWGIAFATLLFLIIWQMPASPSTLNIGQFAPWHALLEVFSIGVAISIFAVGWQARVSNESHNLAMLATAFLAVALFDASHMLSYAGMPEWLTPSGPNKSIQFWLFARYTAAFALLALVARKQILPRARPIFILLSFLAYVSIAIWIVIAHGEWLPTFFSPDGGLTQIKIMAEWVLIVIQLVTLILTRHRAGSLEDYDPDALSASLWLSILSELCFTLYSSVTDLFSIMGHVYKVGAYGFLFQAIVLGAVKLPYRLLSENQKLLQQLTDNIRQVFWMTTPDKKSILYISPAYDDIWGRSSRELLDKPQSWMDAIHPADRERIEQELAYQNHGDFEAEYRIIRPNGSVRWIHSRAFPINDEKGEVSRIAGTAEDITEKKEAASLIAASEARLRAILKTANDGIHILDANGLLVDASDSFLKSLGHDESCLRKIHVWDWDKEFSPETLREAIKDTIASGQPRVFESRFHRRDGSTFPAEIHAHAVHIGASDMIYAVSRDLTATKAAAAEREKLQSQLLQAQKMESIGHLTGGIAHDFNNILGAILGYAELLKQMGMSNAPEERNQKYVREILVAANRAKELIAQMLIFSRLTPESMEGEAPVTLLQPVVKEVVHLLRSSIPSTIEINYHIDNQSLSARIHPVQMHQILLNLGINARDAIDEYGRIDISISQRTTSGICNACHQPFSGDFVELSVSDNGRGIESHAQSKIFDPFFTTKEVGKGTGMGLSVVHGIVHAAGGHIVVESAVGKGTVMRILLPQLKPAADEESTPLHNGALETASLLSGLRILVVDDEQSMASMLHELLSIRGAQVTSHVHPAAALAEFERNPSQFDLVVTDETMPELSGIDMAKAMLQLKPGLPIILCTGYSHRANAEIAREHGIADFMFKPLEPRDLLHRICALTGR